MTATLIQTATKPAGNYAPGTLYGNSQCPVVATDRVNEYGDTIFENHGLRRDRDCIVFRGVLCCASLAKSLHEKAVYDAAPEMLTALQMVLAAGKPSTKSLGARATEWDEVHLAVTNAIDKATAA